MPISYYPNQDKPFVTTGTAFNFSSKKTILTSVSSNSSLSATGLLEGETGVVRIYNSHATNAVTITNPTASNWILQRGLTTVTLLAGEYVKASIYFDGTNYELIYGEALVKNA